jgi:hypothetical protein
MEHKMNSNCGESHHYGLGRVLPFLAIPLAFGLVHGIARHKFTHMTLHHREEWKNGVPPMFAELHRRAHAVEAEKPAEVQS